MNAASRIILGSARTHIDRALIQQIVTDLLLALEGRCTNEGMEIAMRALLVLSIETAPPGQQLRNLCAMVQCMNGVYATLENALGARL